MVLLLSELGHEVHGYSDRFLQDSHYAIAGISSFLTRETFGDVRDAASLTASVMASSPDLFIHFAAQPLVLTSFSEPFETVDININGSINAVRASLNAEVPQLLMITTDKVYKDVNKFEGYSELDSLGGYDPYAASKAAADLVTQSLSNVFSKRLKIDVVRAGNVIGGGDISPNRLIPDIERSLKSLTPLQIRNPSQVRPWQHVLDCLDGYMKIASHAGEGGVWNVGPHSDDKPLSVEQLVDTYLTKRDKFLDVLTMPSGEKETSFLTLNSQKVEDAIGWRARWDSHTAVSETAEWYRRIEEGSSPINSSRLTLSRFLEGSTN